VKVFIEVFTKNLDFLKAFRVADTEPVTDDAKPRGNGAHLPSKSVMAEDSTKGRTFLDTCFVMMPFGSEELNVVYEDFVRPTLENTCGLSCERGDDLFGSNPIMEDIRKSIERADLVVADLTGKNAMFFTRSALRTP